MSFCSQILLICECGCGERVSKPGNRFIHDHHLRGENNPMHGKHHSGETIRKISESNSGENGPNFGKHPTEEQKQKQSESNSGKTTRCTENTKPKRRYKK